MGERSDGLVEGLTCGGGGAAAATGPCASSRVDASWRAVSTWFAEAVMDVEVIAVVVLEAVGRGSSRSSSSSSIGGGFSGSYRFYTPPNPP